MKKHLIHTAAKAKGKKTKTAPTLAEQFAKLWKQIQKEKANIAVALRQQAALVEQFNAEALADEIKLSEQIHVETQHLLGFLPKKSLSFRQRQVLITWIFDNIELLRARPFATTGNLQDIIEELQDHMSAYWGEDLSDEKPSDAKSHDDLFEDETEGFRGREPDEDEDWEYEETPRQAQTKKDSQAAEALFNASSVNKMFRQLAKVFHPDLEQDEDQKAVKHEQMANLLKARENQDIYTIFELFCAQSDKGLPNFDDHELTRLNKLLKQQVQNIKKEKDKALFENPIHGMIYERFYRKNTQFSLLAIQNHKTQLRQLIRGSQQLVKNISTLKDLKQALREKELSLEMDLLAGLDFDQTF